jgi:hypothetical protein
MFMRDHAADFPVQVMCGCSASAAAATSPGKAGPRAHEPLPTGRWLPDPGRPRGQPRPLRQSARARQTARPQPPGWSQAGRASDARHGPGGTPQAALTDAAVGVAAEFGRHGYRRITALLRAEGSRVNAKRGAYRPGARADGGADPWNRERDLPWSPGPSARARRGAASASSEPVTSSPQLDTRTPRPFCRRANLGFPGVTTRRRSSPVRCESAGSRAGRPPRLLIAAPRRPMICAQGR